MGKKHEQDLRLVEGVVSAQLSERDAEIAALRAELTEYQVKSGMWEHSYEEASKDVSYMDADIKALRAQVAELEAWKAAVPVKELNHMLTTQVQFDSVEADIVWKWLKPTR